ncbi:MAG: hypothetical protein ChlgKO_08430 [Chlamydiales bacterium]
MNPSSIRSSLEAVFSASGFASLALTRSEQETYYSIFTKRLQSPSNDWKSAGFSSRESKVINTSKFISFYFRCIGKISMNLKENPRKPIYYSMPKALSTGEEQIDGKLIEIGLLEEPLHLQGLFVSIVKELDEIECTSNLTDWEKDRIADTLINNSKNSREAMAFFAKFSEHRTSKNHYYSITYTPTPVLSLPYGKNRQVLLQKRIQALTSQKV